ncbi:MAG: sugar transferase [Candidatus Omnitrophica bacterium]|nr:sugar transferase [Candidatus Omnitrophota bacterium]
MIKSLRKVYPVYLFIDICFIGFSFYLSYFLRYTVFIGISSGSWHPYFKSYLFTFVLWAVFIIISFKRRNLYSTDRSLTALREISRVFISIFYTGILIGTVIFFAQYKYFSRQIFITSFFLLCVFLSGWRIIKRLIVRRLISKGFHNLNILIVGAGRTAKVVLEEIKRNSQWGFKIIGFLEDKEQESIGGFPILGRLSDFTAIARKHFVDEIIVTIPSERKAISELIKQAKKMRLGLRIVPENFEEPLPLLNITYLGVIPLLTYKERRHHPTEFVLKRLFDFVAALILLIILSPLFIAITVLIKLDSPGSVFYIRKRVGFKGNLFNFYKFRSMVKNADSLKPELLKKNEVKDGVIFKIKKDPRITRVGRFLRRHSLDELPQLFNVLKGDMSLVGPRPPTSDEVEKYNHIHMQRLSIRPGMTGLSQVRGRSELTFRKWVKWDLWYVNNWSFGLDFLVLLWTAPAVFKGKGAY